MLFALIQVLQGDHHRPVKLGLDLDDLLDFEPFLQEGHPKLWVKLPADLDGNCAADIVRVIIDHSAPECFVRLDHDGRNLHGHLSLGWEGTLGKAITYRAEERGRETPCTMDMRDEPHRLVGVPSVGIHDVSEQRFGNSGRMGITTKNLVG